MRKAMVLVGLLVAGCSSFDRVATSSLTPTTTEGGYCYYTYEAPAAAGYELNNEAAERTRMEWLEKWLADNGHHGDYEVLDRQFVKSHSGLLSSDPCGTIYYTVRVPVASP